MKNEKHVKKAVRDVLNSTDNCYHFMPPANGYGRSGIPDIIGHVSGHFFAIETKFGSNKPTANQTRELGLIEVTGGMAWVVTDKNIDRWKTLFFAWVHNINASS